MRKHGSLICGLFPAPVISLGLLILIWHSIEVVILLLLFALLVCVHEFKESGGEERAPDEEEEEDEAEDGAAGLYMADILHHIIKRGIEHLVIMARISRAKRIDSSVPVPLPHTETDDGAVYVEEQAD